MKPKVNSYTVKVGNRDITIDTGLLAAQAGGAAQYAARDGI